MEKQGIDFGSEQSAIEAIDYGLLIEERVIAFVKQSLMIIF